MQPKEQQKEMDPLKLKDPLVFISHDSKDAELAEEFSKLLSRVSAGVLKSFRSSDNKGNQGIEYGTEWYPKIVDALQNASDVVCLLTESSLNRPWILFEAGMAKGKLNTAILGIAFGIPLSKISNGPFAQFQNCTDDETALTHLVKQLVKKIPNSDPDEEIIRTQVESFRKKTTDLLKVKNESKKETAKISNVDVNATAKLFEEVKIMFKELPSRIETVTLRNHKSESGRMIHPGMFDEIMSISFQFEPKIGLQILLSPVREELPWIYDGAMELIEKIKAKKGKANFGLELSNFLQLVRITFEHPILKELYIHNEFTYRISRDLPYQLAAYFETAMSRYNS